MAEAGACRPAALASAEVFTPDMAGLDGLQRVLSFFGPTLIGPSASCRWFMATPQGTPEAAAPRP